MSKLALAGVILALAAPVQAGVITQLALTVGQTVSVTVMDPDHGNTPVLPPSLTWAPLGTPSIITGSTNSAGTGFNFLATAVGSVNATVTYTAPSGVTPTTVTATLPITVSPIISHLGFESP